LKPYQILQAAEDYIFAIWSFIAADNPDAADRIEKEIRDSFARIAQNPRIGHARRDLVADQSLFFTVRSVYQIVYDPTIEPLAILRVLRGGLDVTDQLARKK
jgi:plasmid stabilization system protein ParE